MHKPLINNQIDKILAIGLLLAGLMAGYVFVDFVYLEKLITLDHEIELKKSKNARIDSILANEKELRNKIRQQKKAIGKNRIFLKSSKPATAASELQNYIKKLIATHSNARILTIKPYPVRQHDDYSEASLEIRLKGIGHKELHRVLYMIESMAPVLVIKELDIKRPQLQYTSLVKSKNDQENLSLIMVVSGFFRELSGETQ